MNDNIDKYHMHMSAAPAGQRVTSLAERYARRTGKTVRNG
jgi:hypothetical protein